MHREVDQTRKSTGCSAGVCDSSSALRRVQPKALVIVNADDWGRNIETTNPIFDCLRRNAISSVSAMVFMEDSERAAALARDYNVDSGIHLNFTLPFTARQVPQKLIEHQQRISRFLLAHRYAPVLFDPLLAKSFDYVLKAQLEEFARIYGAAPHRLDGHHHMHLCANVLLQKLLPAGTIVRRNFSFRPGEKGCVNRWFRRMQDRLLVSRYYTTDYFFDLRPGDRVRLKGVIELARRYSVEIETHPVRPDEYSFLINGELERCAEDVEIARGYLLRSTEAAAGKQRDSESVAEFGREIKPVMMQEPVPHICVCICTYQRPGPLKRLLMELDAQNTAGLFTFSIVVADNDPAGSARAAVEEMQAKLRTPVKYCTEPNRSIARARNKVIENAEGDYLALIDDDEFPIVDWLQILLGTCRQYDVDGVLGPVKRHFDEQPPAWLSKSRLYDRRVNPTGVQVAWKESRTGNVLLKREVVLKDPMPFRPEFRAGEDQDFFRRKIEEGRRFVWTSDAIVFETIPPSRWTRGYYVRKALLQGATAAMQPDCTLANLAKSWIAVPLYAFMLPLALLAGQHRFMTVLVKLSDHTGKLLQAMKINLIREEYVSE